MPSGSYASTNDKFVQQLGRYVRTFAKPFDSRSKPRRKRRVDNDVIVIAPAVPGHRFGFRPLRIAFYFEATINQ
jgi:hypothetical protein